MELKGKEGSGNTYSKRVYFSAKCFQLNKYMMMCCLPPTAKVSPCLWLLGIEKPIDVQPARQGPFLTSESIFRL